MNFGQGKVREFHFRLRVGTLNIDIYEGLDWGGGGVWYSLFIKNLAHYSSH